MRSVLAEAVSIAVIVFAVASMLSVGMAYSLGRILRPLRDPRAVFRALVANFVLVPLLAVGIERIIPMNPPVALGLFLLAGAAGAAFLIKLASAAKVDLALSAALLVLLVCLSVVFLPFYVPLAMAHPLLKGLEYEPSSILAMGLPLLTTMIAPMVLGLLLRAGAPRLAAWLMPLCGKLASVALVVIILGTFLANIRDFVRIIASWAIVAAILLIVGGFVVGFLMSRPDRGAVLGLGTAQRNVAGAMVVASQDFKHPDVLVMVTVTSIVGLIVLLLIAWFLGRRVPHVGPPTPEPG